MLSFHLIFSTFVGDDDCKALHTQKTTQLFYQPERGYWFVMVLNVPKEIKSKDGVEVPEYRGAEVQDRIYKTILKQCYNMFRLSWGTFRSNSEDSDEDNEHEQLKKKLSAFFNNVSRTSKLFNISKNIFLVFENSEISRWRRAQIYALHSIFAFRASVIPSDS